MTTILGVQGNGWSVLGYDSRVSMLSTGRVYTLPEHESKVVENGEYLIGTAGDLRILNIVNYAFKPPAPPKSEHLLDKFMVSVFIPALRQCLEEHGITLKDSGSNADILVSVRGKIYEIGETFEWCSDTSGLYGIGSGAQFGLGSLYTSLKDKNEVTPRMAERAVRKALEVSAELDSGSGLPVYVVTQE